MTTIEWKKWIAFAVIVALSVAALVLVIVGVVLHDEPGLANSRVRWYRVPLLVGCRGYVPAADDACSVAEDVVGTVNHRLGFAMLKWADEPVVDIAIVMRAPVEAGADEPGGNYELRGSAGLYVRCDARTMNVSAADDLEWLVVYHEIGHCLGLAHDDGLEVSIMRPVQEPTPDGLLPPWITDSDRKLLREMYAGE